MARYHTRIVSLGTAVTFESHLCTIAKHRMIPWIVNVDNGGVGGEFRPPRGGFPTPCFQICGRHSIQPSHTTTGEAVDLAAFSTNQMSYQTNQTNQIKQIKCRNSEVYQIKPMAYIWFEKCLIRLSNSSSSNVVVVVIMVVIVIAACRPQFAAPERL